MRKKIFKTFGFIILSNMPLMATAVSNSTTSSSEASISKIIRTFKTKLKQSLWKIESHKQKKIVI